jgi:hypothetical protein
VHTSPSRATEGTRSFLFNGASSSNDGVLSQSIATVVGTTYQLSFDFSSTGTGSAQQGLVVQVLDGSTLLRNESIYDSTPSGSGSNGAFSNFTYTFVATSTSTTIRFADFASSALPTMDGDLDNVMVRAITTTNPTMSIAENSANSTVVGTINTQDVDNASVLSYSLTNNAGGAYAINSSTGVVTVANSSLLNFESTPTSTIVVRTTDQGGLTFDKTVTINLTNVNEAPELDNTGNMTLTSITEDQTNNAGQTVASIIASAGGDRITDVDGSAVEGIAITSTTNGNGTWQYSTDNGATWTSVGAVANNSALLLRSTDLLRFIPNGQNATTGDLTFRAWDQTGSTLGQQGTKVDATSNGGATPFSSATEVASITVTAVNDAPTLTQGHLSTHATTNEDTPSNAVTGNVPYDSPEGLTLIPERSRDMPSRVPRVAGHGSTRATGESPGSISAAYPTPMLC